MRKRLLTMVSMAFALAALMAWAVPQEWSVDVSRVSPHQFNAYHGETMELKASFFLRGQPYDVAGDDFSLFWQTNGMGSAYWTAPATAASNTVSAVFTGAMDPGAPLVYGFLGSTGSNYRASFAIRFAASPGAVPNELPLPVQTIDFAKVAVLNAPWATTNALDDATNSLTIALDEAVTNLELQIAANAAAATNYTDSAQSALEASMALAAQAATNHTDAVASSLRESIAVAASSATNYTDSVAASLGALAWVDSVDWADILGKPSWIGDTKPSYSWSEILQRPATWDWSAISSKPTTLSGYGITDAISRTANTMTAAGVYTEYLINPSLQGGVRIRYSSTSDANQTTYMYSGVAARRNGATTDYLFDTTSQSGIVRRSELSSKADASDVSTLANKVDAIETWAIGDETALVIREAGQTNATLTVTYTNDVMYSSAVAESNTLAKARAQTDSAIVTALEVVGTALDAKAPKAWGTLTSGGAPAPDDTLVVEKKKVAITGGGNYASIESSTGCYYVLAVSLGSEWTLESLADAQNPTNAATVTFRDSDGNGVYQIVSTASRTVDAIAGADMLAPSVASVGGNDVVTMNFPVVAAEPPTMYYTPNLTNEFAEASSSNWPGVVSSVVWSGSSGLYTATVTMVGQPGSGFFCAKYIKPGSTYVRYLKPICVPSITIDDITYTISVETVNGKKLMVLTEVN